MAYLDYDVVQAVNRRINSAFDLNLDKIPSTEEEKSILKLGWLIRDIKNNGVKNPVQLIKSGEKYFCHPGTDKILVLTYIYPREIEGFYLWYKDIDPNPLILDVPHFKIRNFIKFINLFNKSSTFKFYSIEMNKNLDTGDKNNPTVSNAVFRSAKSCFLKTSDNFNYDFITYFDRVQWSSTASMKLNHVINFVNDSECIYGDVKFLKKNNCWVPYND